MPCHTFQNDGTTYHVKTSRYGGDKCDYCDRYSAHRLCDYPVGNGETCDVRMCDYCTFNGGRNLDYCKEHRPSGAEKPRKDENAPRWMKSLYAGQCKYCFRRVKVGERILWFKSEKKLYCEGCGEAHQENKR
jgi:hypothetical protein